jgi:hypothetical protein
MTANCDYKAPVRILKAGTPRPKLSLTYSLSIPRVPEPTCEVRILQPENALSAAIVVHPKEEPAVNIKPGSSRDGRLRRSHATGTAAEESNRKLPEPSSQTLLLRFVVVKPSNILRVFCHRLVC